MHGTDVLAGEEEAEEEAEVDGEDFRLSEVGIEGKIANFSCFFASFFSFFDCITKY